MRENIGLFRGKRKDNGEWVEGFYHRVTNSWTHENVHYITHFQDMPITGETILTVQYEVDPDTIGECTELKDKNGKLIFEGDIVLFQWARTEIERFRIAYCEGSYLAIPAEVNQYIWPITIKDYNYDMQIIGNIHDNPELLKGGEG